MLGYVELTMQQRRLPYPTTKGKLSFRSALRCWVKELRLGKA
jgi:hypothetical protein